MYIKQNYKQTTHHTAIVLHYTTLYYTISLLFLPDMYIVISIQSLNSIIIIVLHAIVTCLHINYSLHFVKVRMYAHGIENYNVTCLLLKVCSCMDVNVSNSFTLE